MKYQSLIIKNNAMNDFPDIYTLSDTALQRTIGSFIKNRRINLQLTQEETAAKAAISRSTLSLAERGESTTLSNLLKILRVLDALYVLEYFRETTPLSPLKLAGEAEKRRQRASRGHHSTDKDDTTW